MEQGGIVAIRLPGANANPYLALAAVLAQVQHGLDHKLEPPTPCIGNAFKETGAPAVPSSLERRSTHSKAAPWPPPPCSPPPALCTTPTPPATRSPLTGWP